MTILVFAEAFFKLDEASKMPYHCPPDFGYYATKNGKKQGLKLLTGTYAPGTDLPQTLREGLLLLSKRVDEFISRFIRNEGSDLFG